MLDLASSNREPEYTLGVLGHVLLTRTSFTVSIEWCEVEDKSIFVTPWPYTARLILVAQVQKGSYRMGLVTLCLVKDRPRFATHIWDASERVRLP
jgi:hypothetical protein